MDLKENKTAKSAATKGRLFEIAMKQFNKNGFDQTGMRDLAKAADLSLGAFYYHFRSKEEIVNVYYEHALVAWLARVDAELPSTKKFETRLEAAISSRIETFQPNRELLIALSRGAVDPNSEISPFSEQQRSIREASIGVFERVIEGSDLKVNRKLTPYLPTLLWMYLMGVTFFWIYDQSSKQQNTFKLIKQLSPLISRLIRLSALPLTGRVINPIIEVLETTMRPPSKSSQTESSGT